MKKVITLEEKRKIIKNKECLYCGTYLNLYENDFIMFGCPEEKETTQIEDLYNIACICEKHETKEDREIFNIIKKGTNNN